MLAVRYIIYLVIIVKKIVFLQRKSEGCPIAGSETAERKVRAARATMLPNGKAS